MPKATKGGTRKIARKRLAPRGSTEKIRVPYMTPEKFADWKAQSRALWDAMFNR